MVSVAIVFFALPDESAIVWALLGLGSVSATIIGVRLNRPRVALPWYLLATATLLLMSGDLTYFLLTDVLGHDNPFPSVADVIYLVMYPVAAAGLLILVRTRSAGTDRSALLDALIITVGLGVLSWAFLIAPYVGEPSLTWAQRAFSIAYPLGDVLLLAVLIRLLTGGGPRSPAIYLLAAGTVALLVSDVLYGLIQLNGTWTIGTAVDLGWVGFYALWGAAALQPDMADVAEPVSTRPEAASRTRLLLLVCAALIAPALVVVQTVRGQSAGVLVAAAGCVAVFLLVVLRLDGLLRAQQRQVRREQVLGTAGRALVAAATRERIYRSAADAVAGAGSPGLRVLVFMGQGASLQFVYDSAQAEGPTAQADVSVLHRYLQRLQQSQYVLTDTSREEAGDDLARLLGPDVALLVAGLTESDALSGLMVVAGEGAHTPALADAVGALASTVTLALQRTSLTEQSLRASSEAQFRALLENSSDVILVLARDLTVGYQTPSVQTVFGQRPADLVGRSVTDLLHPDDVADARVLLGRVRDGGGPGDARAEWRVRQSDGDWRTAEVVAGARFDDRNVRGLVLTLRDVTEQRRLEQELHDRAVHDPLTRLANRALFVERLGRTLAQPGTSAGQVAVLVFDLDDFKAVNETLGHHVGDHVLVGVADRLRAHLREADTASRLGGDELVAFVEGVHGRDEARGITERLQSELEAPHLLAGREVTVRMSIGVAVSGLGGGRDDAADLLQCADVAMRSAKETGKGRVVMYDPTTHSTVLQQADRRRELADALDRDEMVLYYQPVVELSTGALVGVEALLRWQHPERGLVLPGEFIDLVEEGGLAVRFGDWVLRRASEDGARLNTAYGGRGSAGLRVSVNVAPSQLQDRGFVDSVTTALADSGLPPGVLNLEITERLLTSEDRRVSSTMADLIRCGVTFAVDDFGTGYSALGYLRRFPVSVMKIDRSFVSGVDRRPDDRALVDAVVRLGSSLGLELVAEGIETTAQREALLRLGCRRGQGFLYSPAVPVEDALAMMEAGQLVPAVAG